MADTFIIGALASAFAVALFLAFLSHALDRMRTKVAAETDRLRGKISNAGEDLVDWLGDLTPDTRENIRSVIGSRRHSVSAATEVFADRVEAERLILEMDRWWKVKPNDLLKYEQWENYCTEILAQAMHLLFPELKAETPLYLNKELKTFLTEQCGLSNAQIDARVEALKFKPPLVRRQPDLCGRFSIDSRLGSANTRRISAPVYFVVESKNPEIDVTVDVMDEAFSYAYDMWRLIQPPKRVHFECLAVDKAIEATVKPIAHMEFGGLASFSVTPVTWKDLQNRTMRITRVEPRAKFPRV